MTELQNHSDLTDTTSVAEIMRTTHDAIVAQLLENISKDIGTGEEFAKAVAGISTVVAKRTPEGVATFAGDKVLRCPWKAVESNSKDFTDWGGFTPQSLVDLMTARVVGSPVFQCQTEGAAVKTIGGRLLVEVKYIRQNQTSVSVRLRALLRQRGTRKHHNWI